MGDGDEDDLFHKLWQQVKVGKSSKVKDLLASAGDVSGLLGRRGEHGDQLLHLAARNGHKTIVKELLRRNADFTARNQDGKQPHELALKLNHTELCEYIRTKAGSRLQTPAASPLPSARGEQSDEAGGSDDDFELVSMLPGLGDDSPPKRLAVAAASSQAQEVGGAALSRAQQHQQQNLSLPTPSGGGAAGADGSRGGSRLSDVRPGIHAEGHGRRLKLVEGLLNDLWPRFGVLAASGEDLDENRKLQIEMKALRGRLGEGGVERVIDERVRLDKGKSDWEAREAVLKDELRASIKEASRLKEDLREAKEDADEHKRLAKRGEREREENEGRAEELAVKVDELGRELREAKREAEAAQRSLEGIKGDLTEVRSARVSGLSPTEFEAALARSGGGGAGGLAAGEIKGFVEEIAEQLSRKIGEAKEELKRAQVRERDSEREREREKEREKEREGALVGDVNRLERQVVEAEERRKKEVNDLREKAERDAQLAEQRLQRTIADKDAETGKARADGVHELKRFEKRMKEAADLERKTQQEALEWNKKLLEQAGAEAKTLKEERNKATDKMQAVSLQLRDSARTAERLEREAKASRAQSTIQALAGFRQKLISTRQALRDMRHMQETQMEEANSFFSDISSEIAGYCSFIAPLTFQRPEALHTERLTQEQLAKGLKHMVAKYRTTSEMCRDLNVEVQNLKGSMRVMCRVRPLKATEVQDGTVVAFREEGVISIHDKTGPKDFQFDTTFGPNHSQQDVFKEASPLLETVADGFNVSVFAYGPTGSGKTHTMTGDKDSKNHGLTYRVLSELFRIQKERAVVVEQQVYLSMFEIYNEQIRDLLPPSGPAGVGGGAAGGTGTKSVTGAGGEEGSVRITMDKKGQVTLEGLNELKCDTFQKGSALVHHGLRCRAVAATNMNEHSSRSHLLIRLTVRSVDRQDGTKKVGKMYLIDLAGSENVAQSGAEGKHLKEAIMINKSLSALHDVMSALSSSSSHVPYRNSTLTKVLTDSLGGSAKCLMYVMVSPASVERSATLSALAFAARCKDIVLQPAKQNVGKVAIEELEAAKKSEGKAKAEAEENLKMYDELVEKTEVSRKVLSECDRFEEKLRELFNFEPVAKKKKQNGKAHPNVEAQYLSEHQRLIVRRQHVHDDLIARIRREIETLGYTVREQNTKLTRAQASNSELSRRLEMERNRAVQMQSHIVRRSRDYDDDEDERTYEGQPSPPLRPVMAWDPSVKPKPVPILFPPAAKASAADRLQDRISQAREARAEGRAFSVPPSRKPAPQRPLPFIGGGLG